MDQQKQLVELVKQAGRILDHEMPDNPNIHTEAHDCLRAAYHICYNLRESQSIPSLDLFQSILKDVSIQQNISNWSTFYVYKHDEKMELTFYKQFLQYDAEKRKQLIQTKQNRRHSTNHHELYMLFDKANNANILNFWYDTIDDKVMREPIITLLKKLKKYFNESEIENRPDVRKIINLACSYLVSSDTKIHQRRIQLLEEIQEHNFSNEINDIANELNSTPSPLKYQEKFMCEERLLHYIYKQKQEKGEITDRFFDDAVLFSHSYIPAIILNHLGNFEPTELWFANLTIKIYNSLFSNNSYCGQRLPAVLANTLESFSSLFKAYTFMCLQLIDFKENQKKAQQFFKSTAASLRTARELSCVKQITLAAINAPTETLHAQFINETTSKSAYTIINYSLEEYLKANYSIFSLVTAINIRRLTDAQLENILYKIFISIKCAQQYFDLYNLPNQVPLDATRLINIMIFSKHKFCSKISEYGFSAINLLSAKDLFSMLEKNPTELLFKQIQPFKQKAIATHLCQSFSTEDLKNKIIELKPKPFNFIIQSLILSDHKNIPNLLLEIVIDNTGLKQIDVALFFEIIKNQRIELKTIIKSGTIAKNSKEAQAFKSCFFKKLGDTITDTEVKICLDYTAAISGGQSPHAERK